MNRLKLQSRWIGAVALLGSLAAPNWCGAQENVPSPIQGKDELRFSFHLHNTEVAPLLRQMAQAAGVKILISDDVHLWMSSAELRDATFENSLQQIADAMNLSWGKIGADTYLVTKNSAPLIAAQNPLAFETPPQLHLLPIPGTPLKPQPRGFLMPTQPQKPLSDWLPFHFNGQNYFRVPLK